MQQVAQRAGVSLSTVSYVLSGRRPVSDATKRKIQAAIDELGYTPNAAARSLASQRTNVLALVYPVLEVGLSSTVQEFVRAAAETARAHGYYLVLWPFENDQAHEIVDLAKQGMADGVLVMEVALDDPRIAALEAAQFPFAMIGRTRRLENRPWVDADFDATVELAVANLTDLGHRRIVFINHSDAAAKTGYAPIFRTEAAFNRAMKARGLTPTIIRCEDNPVAGAKVVSELLDAHPDITAFIMMNEIATFGVMEELRRRQLRIPADVSVMSIVSSSEVAQMSNPPLTTLAVAGSELGSKAVLTLLAQLGANVPKESHTLIPCHEIKGKSIGPVKAK